MFTNDEEDVWFEEFKLGRIFCEGQGKWENIAYQDIYVSPFLGDPEVLRGETEMIDGYFALKESNSAVVFKVHIPYQEEIKFKYPGARFNLVAGAFCLLEGEPVSISIHTSTAAITSNMEVHGSQFGIT